MVEHGIKEEVLNILRLLASGQTGASQRHLSHSLGISLGKTNYLLKSLAAKGLIEIKNFTTGNNKL